MTGGDLPVGLDIARSSNELGCVISGTPMQTQGTANITVTATNISDTASVTVSIAVVSGTPAFAPIDELIYTAGMEIMSGTPITAGQEFINTNTRDGVGAVTSCDVVGPPDGLALPCRPADC